MAWNPGQDVFDGHYVIERQLGEGGFGITYLARTPRGDLKVIKTLHDRILSNPTWYPDDLERFCQALHQEAAILFQCRHPNIVRVENHFDESGLPCIVMEYIEGGTLRERMHQQGKLSETEAIQYIQQIGTALTFVHSKGLLHRDIKPHNIMLRAGTSEAVLIDFGIAREFTRNMTQAHTEFRSDGYAPLEQYRKDAKRGEFTDVYALAATLYALLTGASPVSAWDRQGEIHEQRPDPLQPLIQVDPKISTRVSEAVMWGMALDCNQRPQSVRQWLARLRGESSGDTTTLLPEESEIFVLPASQPILSPPQSWKCIQTITSDSYNYSCTVEKVAFSPDGKTLATSGSSSVKLWNIETGENLHTISDDHFMGFSQDGKTLAGNSRGPSWLWDVITGKEIKQIAEYVPDDYYWNVAISPDFQTLVRWYQQGNAFKPTKLVDLSTGREICALPSLGTPFDLASINRATQFSPDGKILAQVIDAVDENEPNNRTKRLRQIKLWEVSTGKEICTIPNVVSCWEHLAFSPDGQILVLS